MYRLLLILIAIGVPTVAAAQTKVKVGTVRATVIGGVVSAQARGYFKEVGIDVDINLIDASAGFVPLLANNELNVVEGGVSANLFNGAAQGLPIKVAFDSTSTPINHSLMLRTDLKDKIKSIGDLKGRTLAVNAPNSIALYEVTRILETGGLTLRDVDLKVIPFAQMAVAFETKAIDVGLEITPFTALLPKQGLAVTWIDSDTGRETKSGHDLRLDVQHRLGHQEPRHRPSLLHGAATRRARLLRRLSRRCVAPGVAAAPGGERRRDQHRAARRDPLAGAQSRWICATRVAARHPALVRWPEARAL